MAKNNFILQSA